MYIKTENELGDIYSEIIRDELNLKEVIFRNDVSDFAAYSFKPQLRTVGPKYGKNLGFIRNYLTEMDGAAAYAQVESTGVLRFNAPDGTEIELAKDDLLIDVSQKDGFVTEEDFRNTVVLDTNLTEELINEGFMREVISKVQTMRKEAGFEVMDRIRITYNGSERLDKVITDTALQICHDCMAASINECECAGYVKQWDINGETLTLGVEKIEA